MEYFNTFGGNPVSCAIGSQVMAILADEKLMEQALDVGDLIKTELNRMKTEHPILADIRGSGYFLGFEFIKDHYPAPLHAKYFVERMKSKGILMSTDGPDDNVIKFKPPMCFNRQQADQFLQRSREVLNENFLRC